MIGNVEAKFRGDYPLSLKEASDDFNDKVAADQKLNGYNYTSGSELKRWLQKPFGAIINATFPNFGDSVVYNT
ncbi:MAG TPA: hypothetical protein VFZ52_10445 [Chryseolinea sp.]